jgi:hypothetical protein
MKSKDGFPSFLMQKIADNQANPRNCPQKGMRDDFFASISTLISAFSNVV